MRSTVIITTGLGAGSYPDERPLPENSRECCMCGDVHDLRERDGHIFCPSCEDEYLFATSDQETQLKFIRSDYSIERDFLLNHWWEELDESAKMVIVADAFSRRYKAINFVTKEAALEKAIEKKLSISMFVRDCVSDFGNWFRSQEVSHV